MIFYAEMIAFGSYEVKPCALLIIIITSLFTSVASKLSLHVGCITTL